MGRYRSSFEDLAGAIAAAAAIKPGAGEEGKKHTHYPGVALVSFDSPSESPEESAPESSETPTLPPAPSVPSNVESAPSHFEEVASTAEGMSRRPPKLPELTDITDHVVRCEKIIAWIVEAIGASEVFIADGAGQHVAGVIPGAEERIARAGEAVAAIARLSGAVFGHGVSIFELHLGEGPFLQLIGFRAEGKLYFVGLLRAEPLTPRQAHAIRLACKHALDESFASRRVAASTGAVATVPAAPIVAPAAAEVAEAEGEDHVTPVPAAVTSPDSEDDMEPEPDTRPPQTLAFGETPLSQVPTQPTPGEFLWVRRILAYLEAHAPEPHTARLRLALRAGLTLIALEHPESIGMDVVPRIEAAAQEILCVDRDELRRVV